MATMARWRSIKWGVDPAAIRAIVGLSTSYKVKKVTDSTGNSRQRGHEPQPLTITYEVAKTAGADPLKEYQACERLVGSRAPFYLGGRRFGPAMLQLDEVSLDPILFSNAGEILQASISLAFTEFVQDEAGEDRLQILYQGKDIYNDISLSSCIHDMHAGSRSDELEIRFNDTRGLWDNWRPTNDDVIEVIDGAARTGKMYVESVKPDNGSMVLRAFSTPPSAKNSTSKAWEKVKLLQLAAEIAERHGLELKTYEVTDQLYEYVSQHNLPDFAFLERRCTLESVAFLVYDGKLVLYGEQALERQEPAKTLEVGTDADYEYNNNATEAYGRAIIKNGQWVGTHAAGSNTRQLEKVIQLQISNQAEANRFAAGLLRNANKNAVSGIWSTALMRDLAAGSVVNIKTKGAGTWDGPAFLYRVRHDYASEKSKVFFRRPLEGY